MLSFILLADKKRLGLLDYKLFVVTSESMGKTAPKGSISIVNRHDDKEYKQGDIIAFLMPTDSSKVILHRVVANFSDSTENSGDGKYYKTKGDSNSTEDPWFVSNDSIVGTQRLNIPLVGYLVMIIQTPIGMFLAVLIPCMYVLISETMSLRFHYQKNYEPLVRYKKTLVIKRFNRLISTVRGKKQARVYTDQNEESSLSQKNFEISSFIPYK